MRGGIHRKKKLGPHSDVRERPGNDNDFGAACAAREAARTCTSVRWCTGVARARIELTEGAGARSRVHRGAFGHRMCTHHQGVPERSEPFWVLDAESAAMCSPPRSESASALAISIRAVAVSAGPRSCPADDDPAPALGLHRKLGDTEAARMRRSGHRDHARKLERRRRRPSQRLAEATPLRRKVTPHVPPPLLD